METTYHTLVDSLVGQLTLRSDGEYLTGVYMSEQRWRPELAAGSVSDPGPFSEVSRQLAEYFAGQRTSFDLPLAPSGTAFQLSVWRGLQSIPYGTTMSYHHLAGLVGAPRASRAVGAANGRNPISIVIPCHRVIGSGGALTGYGGGLDRKRVLLDLERQHL